jgi:prephenate dehydratase
VTDSADQRSARVAFQGELGAFSEEAVHRFFGEGAVPVPARDFAEVGRAVRSGDVDFGVLPIENSLAGSVVGSYDVLAGGDLAIVGEVVSPIHHCVLGIPGSSIDRVSRILSHPVALAQCTRFLRARPAVEALAVYDTAGAAKEVADLGDPTRAAIAGRGAADRYGLEILAADVEDRSDNQTRFLVVVSATSAPALAGAPPGKSGPAPMKTAILLETENRPGALLEVLKSFAERQINLTKLESRPAGEPWSYRFFLECETGERDDRTERALEALREKVLTLQVLGTYPRWAGPVE